MADDSRAGYNISWEQCTHTHRHRTEPKEYQEKKIFSLSPVEMVRVILVYISCHMLPINRVLIDFLAEINTGLSNIL